jgi:hypothetical protein
MGWESRGGRGRYYTKSHRAGTRIVREYIGTGPVAEAVAQADAAERARRAEERAALAAEWARLDVMLSPFVTLDAIGETLARASLCLAGFHQHDRGTRRKRRDDHRP